MIIKAKRPLIMVGAAATGPGWSMSLFDRAQARDSILHDADGQGRRTGGSNLYLGTAALSERDYVHDAIDQADLIIAIGHDTVEKPPFLMGRAAGGPRVIHVGYTSAHVEQVFYPDAEVIGDIGASVTALTGRLEGRLSSDPDTADLRKEILGHLNERAEDDRFPVIPQRLVHDVRP